MEPGLLALALCCLERLDECRPCRIPAAEQIYARPHNIGRVAILPAGHGLSGELLDVGWKYDPVHADIMGRQAQES